MDWLSNTNKFLTVRKEVILTPLIDKVIAACDPYFESLPAEVSSGGRTPEMQLFDILDYARKNGIAGLYPEFLTSGLNEMTTIEGKTVYAWQRTWSKLLNIGIIINPPIAAEVLFDYVSGGINKKGQIIQPSPHIMKNGEAHAFDISGGSDGASQEIEIVKTIPLSEYGIRSYKYEPKQNCVHITCL